ncbi:glycosyltransferase [Demequina capsici]|uniref:Glycosyltransferase n=1 Tax=Demequina capsici TaxID=3075620 RepID=A0AA96F771_9MICO|nr:glycosyltransferase [Demequina sp. OYTSA14]WNM25341.1 glycosyltransferase [Demequina sp. OYTSA14]
MSDSADSLAPSSDAPTVHVHLNHGQYPTPDPAPFGPQYPGPYGYGDAGLWFTMRHSTDAPESRLVSTIRQGMKLILGFDLLHAYRNRAAIAAADIVWTHTEKEHLAIGALKRAGLLRRDLPVIAQSVWLWARLERWDPVRRRVAGRLLSTSTVHTVHSPVNLEAAARDFPDSARLVPYGIPLRTEAREAAARTPGRRPRVVAPGNDRDRDWEVLGEAAALRPGLDVVVLSKRRRARRLAAHANVTVRQAHGSAGMRKEYADADVVVVPLAENDHASGATTVLQALSSGLPLVVTRTGGIELYAGDVAEYCEPGDAASLADAIDRAYARADDALGAEHMTSSGLTQLDFVARHVLLTRAILAGEPLPDEASAARPIWEGLLSGSEEPPAHG